MNKYLELLPEVGVVIFNNEALREDLGITNEEIAFMAGLRYFQFHEPARMVKDGIKQKESILLDPICIALYDFYYGAKIAISRGVEFDGTESKMRMAKSIFQKYSPETYIHCF